MFPVETPASRATDPNSSHLAEQEINASGSRAAQQQMAAAAVKAYPGKTSKELAFVTGIDRYVLARRLPECETGKRVRRGQERRCSVSGRMAVTWFPPGVDEQTDLFPREVIR